MAVHEHVRKMVNWEERALSTKVRSYQRLRAHEMLTLPARQIQFEIKSHLISVDE
jgi:hypothetical protein